MISGDTKICLQTENGDILYKSILFFEENKDTINLSKSSVATPFGFKNIKKFISDETTRENLVSIEFKESDTPFVSTKDHFIQKRDGHFIRISEAQKGLEILTYNDKILTINKVQNSNKEEQNHLIMVYNILGAEKIFSYYSAHVISRIY